MLREYGPTNLLVEGQGGGVGGGTGTWEKKGVKNIWEVGKKESEKRDS